MSSRPGGAVAPPRRGSRILEALHPRHIRDAVDRFAASSPSRFALTAFLLLIMIFTGLLSLPIASASGEGTPFAQALFSAVSAVCVTGLSVLDVTSYWSGFGSTVIVLAAQIGGIGVLTLASALGMIVARRLGLRQRLMAASDSNPMRMHTGPVSEGQAVRLGEVGGLLATVAISSIVIEALLTVAYFPAFLAQGRDPITAAWQSLVSAIMAFTNTGILPFAEGIEPFIHNEWFLLVTMTGVFLGSIGYPVIYAISRNPRKPKRWSLHVKLTLYTTVLLFLVGGLLFTLFEWGNPKTLGEVHPLFRPLWGMYLSAMTRSGGFSIFNIEDMGGASLTIANLLMFIGGGSASTAGGIKVTTFAVLFLAAMAEAKGKSDIEAFNRRIPADVLRVAVSILLWGIATVSVSTIILLQITGDKLEHVLFDVISAFATVGLSTGLTRELSDPGIYVLAATMFAGRIGTVTLAAALAARTTRQLFLRPEERPIVG